MAIRTVGGLERKDMMLDFGEASISSATTVTFGTTTEYSDGVVIDAGNTDLEGMNVVINVKTAAAGGTMTFNLLCGGDSFTQIASTGALAATAVTQGKAIILPIPRDHAAGNKYKLQVVGGTGASAGAFSAYVDTYQGV